MMAIPSDTSAEAEHVQLQLLRAMSPRERAMMALRLSDEVIRLSRRAIIKSHPGLTRRQIDHLFICLHYGPELAEAVSRHLEGRENGRPT